MINSKSNLLALRHFWKSRPFFDPVSFLIFGVIGLFGYYFETQYSINIVLLVFGCFCVGFFVEVERAKWYCRKNKIELKEE